MEKLDKILETTAKACVVIMIILVIIYTGGVIFTYGSR